MALVYWIRKESHTNFLEEGYVGVTTNRAENRFTQHKYDADNGSDYTIHRAIRKYGDELVVQVLLEGSEEYCYLMENRIRPEKFIGWNIAVGGSKPPSNLGKELSEETKLKIGKANKQIIDSMTPEQRTQRYAYLKGLKRTPETLEKYKKAQEGKHTSWLIKNANLSVWAIAQDVYLYLIENKVGGKKLSAAFDLKEWQVTALMKKIKAGWNPSEDSAHLTWLSEYKLKERG